MNQAQREIQQIVERFTTGAHGQVVGGVDRYRAELERDLAAVVARYGAKREVEKLPNGINKVCISDAAGQIVAEYHEARRPGPKPLPPEQVRSARLSMRTYPDIEAKARRLGTAGVEEAIRRAKEPSQP